MFLGRRKQVLQVGRAADSYWLLSGGEPPLRLVVDIRGGLEGGKRMRAFVRRLVGIAPPEPPLPLPPPRPFSSSLSGSDRARFTRLKVAFPPPTLLPTPIRAYANATSGTTTKNNSNTFKKARQSALIVEIKRCKKSFILLPR